MAVSDPLIKELKGYILPFINLYENNEAVTDDHESLISFECCLENIFYSGLKTSSSIFGLVWNYVPWSWLEDTSKWCEDEESHDQLSSILECIKTRRNIYTNEGNFRLFVRYCLVRKVLHYPVEQLIYSGKWHKYYTTDSVIGNEILVEIFLSVLYQCSKINFKLDLMNSPLLDLSWELPRIVTCEVVPTNNLGISVSFSKERAVILKIRSNSVISECTEISIGDIVECLNDQHITSIMKGRFGSIMKPYRSQPIKLKIIKAFTNPNEKMDDIRFHPAVLKLFRFIDVDPEYIRNRILESNVDDSEVKEIGNSISRSGFKVIYMGYVHVGRNGDVKIIDKAFSTLMSHEPTYRLGRVRKLKIDVMFEMGDLGVKFTYINKERLLEEHAFMEISSCGGVKLMPKYFCYVAGKEFCNVCRKFKCFIFLAPTINIANTILDGIGEGFQRTHYAV